MERTSDAAPSYVLVLTATVSLSRGAKMQRSDAATRRDDYLNALNFWLQNPDPRLNRIVFLENSGDDLTAFRELAAGNNPYQKDIEFISVPSMEIPDGIHYGIGELRTLDDGLAQSQMVRTTTHFIKATGRLIFPGLSRLLDHLPSQFDIVTECRIPTSAFRKGLSLISAVRQRREAYATTSLIIFRTATYEQYFRGLYRTMEPWTRHGIVEPLVYDRICEVSGNLCVLWRYPVNCDPIGVSGQSNGSYHTIPRRAMGVVRGMLRGTDIWI